MVIFKIWFKNKNKVFYSEDELNIDETDFFIYNKIKSYDNVGNYLIRKYLNMDKETDSILSFNCFNCFNEYNKIVVLADVYVVENFIRKLKINKLING